MDNLKEIDAINIIEKNIDKKKGMPHFLIRIADTLNVGKKRRIDKVINWIKSKGYTIDISYDESYPDHWDNPPSYITIKKTPCQELKPTKQKPF